MQEKQGERKKAYPNRIASTGSEFLPDLDLNLLASLVMSGEKPKDLKFRQSMRKGNS